MKTWLQVYVGPDRAFRDGDVISCCTWRLARQLQVHSAMFRRGQDRRLQRINRAGLLPFGDPCEDFCAACFRTKITRTGRLTAIKTRLSDGAEIQIQDNVKFEDFSGFIRKMRVEQYFDRELRTFREHNARGKPLFGTNDLNVVLYCGKQDYSHANLDICWTAAESKLGASEQQAMDDFKPFSDPRRRLWLAVEDMADSAAQRLSSELMDEEGVIVEKRESFVAWRSISGIVEADVLDRRKELRLDREATHDSRQIVTVRTR